MLRTQASAIIKRQKPIVIGITGSVGKTTTKEAVYSVVSAMMTARKSDKNFNNEIGLPLTIIGGDVPGRSIVRWCVILLRGARLSFFQSSAYPKVLVLEMGADRTGDLQYLTDIVNPDIGIVTAVGLAHAEHLGDLDAIAKEKSVLAKQTKRNGWLILNADDERVARMAEKAKTHNIITFGLTPDAAIRGSDVATRQIDVEGNRVWGVGWKLQSDGHVVPMFMHGVVGKQAVYAGLAAAACGVAMGMHLVQIGEALRTMTAPRGRMRVLRGIKHTTIIDDTYNASPLAMRAALETLAEMTPEGDGRRVACLGDMLELGKHTEREHYDIGLRVVENTVDLLITVGQRSRDIELGAKNAGMSEDAMLHFPDAESARKVVQEKIRKGDIVLVKGSQGIRMERVVKEIMTEPDRASEELVRQERSWMK
ncbi:MAG: UDP-N-acetylmuramoyl-tripeptide--D-alanyl-D-alanine ligase [bacterium]|nr:UDP-N-acetylmuramoyl-tripeptide--D-alanyl-D-alanine ligase [bacterium]